MTKSDAAFAVHNFLEYLQEGEVVLSQLEFDEENRPHLVEVAKSMPEIIAEYIKHRGEHFE